MLRIRTNVFPIAAIAALSLVLTACGGGGGSSIPAAGGNAATQPTSTGNATAKMTINIPAKTSATSHVNPKYISASTQSMTIGIVSGGKTTNLATVNLTPASTGCSVVTGGVTQCNVSFVTTAGTDTFALSMYDGTNGTGNLLSTGDVSATLTAGANTTVAVDLDGVPASLSLVLGAGSLPVGTASSTGVFVQALDAGGNLIIGPGGFASPITLAITGDTYKTLALSSSSVTSPGQVVTLAYNGGTNVGSTITPSATGVTAATGATFAGSGATDTLFQYSPNFGAAPNTESGAQPSDVAAGPNGTAAVLYEYYQYLYSPCCSYLYDSDAIVTMTATAGAQTAFTGDTSDYYNPPAAGSVTVPGMTVVHGMSTSLETDEFDAQDDIAVGATGLIYYGGDFESSSAPNCSGGTIETGTLGVLNPTAGTTTEVPLEGYAGAIKVDSSGNVWFIEDSGSCSLTGNLIPSGGYAIGELKAGSSTPVETPFNSVGLSGIGYPADMSITPDGSQMFIADGDNSTVTKIATATFAPTTPVALTNSLYPESIATGPDGTTLWWGDEDTGEDLYYYGYVPGSKTFSTSNLSEPTFPINYFESYAVTYADGSFWAGQDEEPGGLGRVNTSGASPLTSYFPTPTIDEYYGQELESISGGGGYVWAVDSEYYNIDAFQYGVSGSGTIAYKAHRFGAYTPPPTKKPTLKKSHHAVDAHPHARPR